MTQPARTDQAGTGHRSAQARRAELPLVIAVLADLTHRPMLEDAEAPVWVDVSQDSLDDYLRSLAPELSYSVPNTLTGEGDMRIVLSFRDMAHFLPERVLEQVQPLHHLNAARQQLAALRGRLMRDPQARQAFDQVARDLSQGDAKNVEHPDDDWAMQQVRPLLNARVEPVWDDDSPYGTVHVRHTAEGVWSSKAASADQRALAEVLSRSVDVALMPIEPRRAQGIVESFIASLGAHAGAAAGDALKSLEKTLAAIDSKISVQLGAIIHHPSFERLEASWRGLQLLLASSGDQAFVKVRVACATDAEWLQALGPQAMDQRLRRGLCIEHAALGQAPVGLLLCEHTFQGEADAHLLFKLALAASDLQVPVLAGAAPELLGLKSFRDLSAGPELSAWMESDPALETLQTAPQMQMVGLVLPRFRLRMPYVSGRRVGGRLAFTEYAEGADSVPPPHQQGLWAPALWLAAAQLAQAFARTGWFHDIDDIAVGLRNDKASDAATDRAPTLLDTPITDSQHAALVRAGLIPLREVMGTGRARLDASPSFYRPAHETQDGSEVSPDWLSMMTACHVHHLLQHRLRLQREPMAQAESCEALLRGWLQPLVLPAEADPGDASLCAPYPLRRAEVTASQDAALNSQIQLTITARAQRTAPMPIVLTLNLPPGTIRAPQSATDTAIHTADLHALADQASAGRSARTKFLARMHWAEHALQRGQHALAGPLLEELASQIERLQLKDWEDPRLIVKVWMLLRHWYATPSAPADAQQRSAALLQRICQLDPSAAIHSEG